MAMWGVTSREVISEDIVDLLPPIHPLPIRQYSTEQELHHLGSSRKHPVPGPKQVLFCCVDRDTDKRSSACTGSQLSPLVSAARVLTVYDVS